jgi:hypothetical protein
VHTGHIRRQLAANYPGDKQMARLWFFCKTAGADMIGWDPTDIRDATACEYGIYIKVHEATRCELLSTNFKEFIHEVCLGTGMAGPLRIRADQVTPIERTWRPCVNKEFCRNNCRWQLSQWYPSSATPMTIKNWKSFYDSLVILPNEMPPPGNWRPTCAELDAFESKHGVKLPKSYRDFIEVFGPGRLGRAIEITAPAYPKAESFFELEYRNSRRDDEKWLTDWPEEIRPKIRRFIYFATYSDEFAIAWDPQDVRHPITHEYAIWEQRPDNTLHFRGNTFREFVEMLCEHLFAKDDDPELAEIGPWRSFAPAPDPYA